jgi:hypothetical protein
LPLIQAIESSSTPALAAAWMRRPEQQALCLMTDPEKSVRIASVRLDV